MTIFAGLCYFQVVVPTVLYIDHYIPAPSLGMIILYMQYKTYNVNFIFKIITELIMVVSLFS